MRRFIIIILLILCNQLLFAQRNCGTEVRSKKYLDNHPIEKIKREKIEKLISHTNNISLKNSLIIPIVFHVVYNNSNENISDNQIISQLNVLNEDFNRTNLDANNTPLDFLPITASMQINFCLAKRNPEGLPTTGITRKQTYRNQFLLNDNNIYFDSTGGTNAWDPTKYLNVWISNIGGAGINGVLGWAQYPGSGMLETDGVVIDFEHFGTTGTAIYPYDRGRTLTHEVGHWLNLVHVWGDNNCGDDFVTDTPTQEEANFGCIIHPSPTCNNNGDMFMNFMDYTNDACMNSFTIGQRNRVWSSINNYRLSLINSDGCDEIIVNNCDAGVIEIVHPENNTSGCSNPLSPIVIIKNFST